MTKIVGSRRSKVKYMELFVGQNAHLCKDNNRTDEGSTTVAAKKYKNVSPTLLPTFFLTGSSTCWAGLSARFQADDDV